MHKPLIMSLFRGFLCASVTLALAHVHANCQTQGSKTSDLLASPFSSVAFAAGAAAISSNLFSSLNPVPLHIPDLPDSPGTVLRRRKQAAADTPDPESVSGSGTFPGQLYAAPQPQRPSALAAAEARASDVRLPSGCLAVAGAAGDGVVALRDGGEPPNSAPAAALPKASATASTQPPAGCPPTQNPYQRFLNSSTPIPLTPRQKAYLAIHNFIEPGNIVTILGTSGIAIASDSHTAYGPGWRGFGSNAGTSFVQDATGDFFGTFLIPSIAREDPHYHRMPNASIPRRTLHAISRTVIAQSDYGRPMPNYATLLTYPITAEIANLYVPGVATNGPSTVERVLTGYATDPIDNIITEFLPDVAKRIHVRVIFVQQIINQVATGQPINMFP